MTEGLAEMACGRVRTLPARFSALGFLTANIGVTVTAPGPLIKIALGLISAFFPRVLRSRTLLSTLPPRAVGGTMVGIFWETWGRDIAGMLVFLPNVLRSRASAALAVAITPTRKTVTTKTVRINFIHEPPYCKGTQLNPFFWYLSFNHLFLLLIYELLS
jgi:hypothetical protein